MAAPLEFKRRVRLPEFTGEERIARRRSWTGLLGALTWIVTVGLAVGIAEGAVPIERWLHVERSAPERARATRGTAARTPSPRAPAPAVALAAPEPEPEPAREPPPEPEATQEPEPPTESEAEPALEAEPRAVESEREIDRAPADEPVETRSTEVAAAPTAPSETVASAGASCEQAAANAVQSIEIGRDEPDDLTREDYEVVLNRGSYFAHCGVGERTLIEICAAVQRGRAIGVTVKTTPASPAAASCIARAVRSLGFPSHPRLDVVRTRFD